MNWSYISLHWAIDSSFSKKKNKKTASQELMYQRSLLSYSWWHISSEVTCHNDPELEQNWIYTRTVQSWPISDIKWPSWHIKAPFWHILAPFWHIMACQTSPMHTHSWEWHHFPPTCGLCDLPSTVSPRWLGTSMYPSLWLATQLSENWTQQAKSNTFCLDWW